MARIFIDGFESGDHDMWDGENNATIVSSVGLDMDGDYCLDLDATGEYLQKNIATTDEMYFAFLYRPDDDLYSNSLIGLYNGSTLIGRISRLNVAGGEVLRAITGAGIIETGSIPLSEKVTYFIELYYKVADSGGRCVVKINGITDIDFTGDTKPGANTQFNTIKLGSCEGSYSYAYFDNFIMDDADWIGDTKIQAVVPTGAGNTTGWTPSAGANWECIDEIPPNDADYVSINAIDTTDTYVTGNLAGAIANIKCVQVQARVKTDGAPTPTNLKLVTRVNGTDYLSGDNLVPIAEKGFYNLWELNPDDAAAWEEADVNAMEVGIKSAT